MSSDLTSKTEKLFNILKENEQQPVDIKKLRNEFILPLLKLLEWNVDKNVIEGQTNSNEVFFTFQNRLETYLMLIKDSEENIFETHNIKYLYSFIINHKIDKGVMFNGPLWIFFNCDSESSNVFLNKFTLRHNENRIKRHLLNDLTNMKPTYTKHRTNKVILEKQQTIKDTHSKPLETLWNDFSNQIINLKDDWVIDFQNFYLQKNTYILNDPFLEDVTKNIISSIVSQFISSVNDSKNNK